MYLPFILLIAAQLLLQKATDIIGDIRIVVIDKAVISRLCIEKGIGLFRLLQQCRGKPLILGDDIVAGMEAVETLSPQAAGQQGAVADLRRVQHIAVSQQLIGRIEILPRRADVLHRHGVVIAQRVRHTCLRRCGQLALGVKSVLMQPVKGIRVLTEGLAIQCAPAAVGIRLTHEATEIVGGRLGHGDLQHGVPGDLPGADFGHIALRKSRVAAVAQGIHLLRRPICGSVHHGRAGGILIPAAQHRYTYQQHRRQPPPCPQRGGRILLSAAKMHRVQKEACQRRQQQPPYGDHRREQHRRRGQNHRKRPETQAAGMPHIAAAPQAAEHPQHAQHHRQAYAAILLCQKAGIVSGMELLPRLQHIVQQLGKTVGHSVQQHQYRQQADCHPRGGRQP